MDWSTLLMIALIGGALYFLMIRPQQKRTKEQKDLMGAIGPGSRVMTISGIVGTVKYVGEKQAILEVSPGVEMTIVKAAISTQKVDDEFEYADEDGESHPVGAIEPSDAEPAQLEDSAAADVADEPTWDNPGTEKN